jgi:toxin ParE1/3/4
MKSNRSLRLREQAQLDVRSILRYTTQQWGTRQKNIYRAKLYQVMRSLLDHPERGRSRDEYFLGCRSLPVERHIIFYHLTEDEIIVDRVLHTSQDATGNVTP